MTILFEKCTAEILVMLYISTQYTNKSETILHTKPVIAFLNRSSGIKRGQPHNTYNIIITDTKQRQPLCFFCVVVQPFRSGIPMFLAGNLKKCPCSKPSRTKAPYTYNEATTIAQIYIYV